MRRPATAMTDLERWTAENERTRPPREEPSQERGGRSRQESRGHGREEGGRSPREAEHATTDLRPRTQRGRRTGPLQRKPFFGRPDLAPPGSQRAGGYGDRRGALLFLAVLVAVIGLGLWAAAQGPIAGDPATLLRSRTDLVLTAWREGRRLTRYDVVEEPIPEPTGWMLQRTDVAGDRATVVATVVSGSADPPRGDWLFTWERRPEGWFLVDVAAAGGGR